MNHLIADHLDIWTTAELPKKKGGRGRGANSKKSPHGIQKLRELILELAVRGKLVPQDPSDEPASELLKKIATEKAKQIKAGEIKKPKPLPSIGEDQKPVGLPKGWAWTQFGTVAEIERGGSPRPIKSFLTDDPDGLNWIKIGDTDQGGKFITSTNEKIRREGLIKTRMVYPGDFLLTNSMSFGRPYITKVEGCIHDGWLRISPPPTIDKDYLYLLLSSPYVVNAFKAVAAGAVVLNLNADKVREIGILIPPVNEQQRIAAKVDELMGLCDKLEQEQAESGEAHQQLVETLLGTLTRAENNTEREAAWQRIAEHFDILFTTEASIDQLKQTILQLAVMGKLVPQDPTDEPASQLLKKIASEKERLIKEKKIKKKKPLQEISEDEVIFTLPQSWEWVRLGLALKKITDGTHHSPPNGERGDYLYISAKNIKNEGVQISNATYVTKDVHEEIYSRCDPVCGDVLYIKDGATTGIVTINDLSEPFSMLSSVALLKCTEGVLNSYLLLALRSPYFYDEMRAGMTGVAITRVTLKKLDHAFISLPPLEEQHRIVAKVDELMAACDNLKERLQEARVIQVQLADAIVEQAVA